MAARGWTEVRVLVAQGWHELVAEALTHGPWSSVAFGRSSLASDETPPGREWVRSYLPEDEDVPAARRAVRERLRELGERTGAPELEGLEPVFRRLPPEDYARSWRKTWRPFRVGRLCVVPPGSRHRLRPGDVRLELEPGAAFGTGRHGTTRACLEVLQERLEPGTRVLDAGCGSGILGVAAALLGAREVLGIDLDPHAPPQAAELARGNGVGARCTFRAGGCDGLGPADGAFDALLANLYADLLQAHAADLSARLRPGGWFAAGGCPERHGAATREALARAGLAVSEVLRRGRWLTFCGEAEAR